MKLVTIALAATVLLGSVAQAQQQSRNLVGQCRPATAAVMYHLGRAHSLVWKSPHDAVGRVYLRDAVNPRGARFQLQDARARLSEARLPRAEHNVIGFSAQQSNSREYLLSYSADGESN
jgi:hypothetical protein